MSNLKRRLSRKLILSIMLMAVSSINKCFPHLNIAVSPLQNKRAPRCSRRAGCEAPSLLRGCKPPCLRMRNNAPVEHCAAEAIISDTYFVSHVRDEFHFAHSSHNCGHDTSASEIKKVCTFHNNMWTKCILTSAIYRYILA